MLQPREEHATLHEIGTVPVQTTNKWFHGIRGTAEESELKGRTWMEGKGLCWISFPFRSVFFFFFFSFYQFPFLSLFLCLSLSFRFFFFFVLFNSTDSLFPFVPFLLPFSPFFSTDCKGGGTIRTIAIYVIERDPSNKWMMCFSNFFFRLFKSWILSVRFMIIWIIYEITINGNICCSYLLLSNWTCVIIITLEIVL